MKNEIEDYLNLIPLLNWIIRSSCVERKLGHNLMDRCRDSSN